VKHPGNQTLVVIHLGTGRVRNKSWVEKTGQLRNGLLSYPERLSKYINQYSVQIIDSNHLESSNPSCTIRIQDTFQFWYFRHSDLRRRKAHYLFCITSSCN